MADLSFAAPATVFWGPDTEKWSTHRESNHFQRLDAAIIWAVENLSTDQKQGARIQSVGVVIPWADVEEMYQELKAN
jgi:hypothetical protein